MYSIVTKQSNAMKMQKGIHMEYIINEKLIISERETVEERFSKLGIFDVKFSEISNFVNSEANTVFYFDMFLNPQLATDKNVYFAWIDTGYRYLGEPVFIALKKVEDFFTGYYVGTAKFLVKGLCENNPYKSKDYRNNLNRFLKKYQEKVAKRHIPHLELIENNKQENGKEEDLVNSEMRKILEKCGYEISDIQEDIDVSNTDMYINFQQEELTEVTEEIFSQLIFPSWNSIKGLDRYIKIIGKRIEQLINTGKTEFYVKNHLGSVIVNSGLMNLFGQDYLILYRIHEKYKTYVAYQIIGSKREYLEHGFSKEQTCKQLKPICFFEEGEDIFCPTLEDFDLNQHSLMHIIEERRERFPENLQETDANKIASHLLIALERGVKMQERDRAYAKAIYSGKEGKISWVMPLHINERLIDAPELVMVIKKSGEFYEVKTILPYNNEIKDRITALSLYSKSW